MKQFNLVDYLSKNTLLEMRDDDPVLARLRAEKAKRKYLDTPISSTPNRISDKIAALKAQRAEIMRDMEQEAEPEGGPIADRYGDMLNKIDAAIAKLMKSTLFEAKPIERELVLKVAQEIADDFTADDELDLKYSVNPKSYGFRNFDSRGGFDLDTTAGPNTPGEDWKDVNGFGIDNYIGRFAGGSFIIKDEGDVFAIYNAAKKSSPVAYFTPDGEVDIVYKQEQYYDKLKEKENPKSNKMTRNEIKEMIRQNVLNELSEEVTEDTSVDFGDPDVRLSKLYSDFYEDMEPSMNEADLEENETDMIEKAIKAKKIDPKAVEAAAKKAAAGDSTELAVLMATGMNFAKLEEDARTDAEEEGYKDGMKDEKADLEGDKEEVTDTEKVDIKVKEPIANEPTLTADEKAIQGHLDQALKLAQSLDDQNAEKLIQQIGNTVTFFTRDFVVKEEKTSETMKNNLKEFDIPDGVQQKMNQEIKDKKSLAALLLSIYDELMAKEPFNAESDPNLSRALALMKKVAKTEDNQADNAEMSEAEMDEANFPTGPNAKDWEKYNESPGNSFWQAKMKGLKEEDLDKKDPKSLKESQIFPMWNKIK